ncbi:MAG TPA: winged helix-turn-helix domain-containing protein [Vicinamibacteria bacterium]|nr:winged helix-turn-helix domain-containing protein [Vicinamibacteria bacterium]
MSQTSERPSLPHEGEDGEGRRLRFGVFDLDSSTGELRKSGVLVKLRQQPARVLIYLASRPGRLVTRDELQSDVWGDDTFVDFEQGLNYCIKEIRAALSDSAEAPLYVETLPRRGYRFIAPIEGGGALLVPQRRSWVSWTHAALTLAAVALTAYFASQRPPEPPEWQRVTFRRGSLSHARFAPGSQILSSASWDASPAALYATIPGSPDARPLAVENARLVSVSSAGEVAFIQERPGAPPVLARAPLAGGPVKLLLEAAFEADGTLDGSSFAVVHRVPGEGASIEYPIGRRLARVNAPSHLRLSPDGSRLAFIEHPRTGDDLGYVAVLDSRGTALAHSRTFASAEGLAWSPSGEEVWFTAGETGSSLALRALDLRGRERLLLPASGRLVLQDVARDGRVLLDRLVVHGEIGFRGPDGSERELGFLDAPHAVALSRDGRMLLFSESGEAGGPEYGVYLRSTDGQAPVRLGSGVPGSLTPDGRFALVVPLHDPDHVEFLPTGPGETRRVRHDGIVQYDWAGLTPDGARLVFVGRKEGHNLRVWVGAPDGGEPTPITPDGLIVARDTVAPDGRTLFAPCVPRTFCIYPLAGGEARPLSGLEGAVPTGWDPTGEALVVRTARTGPRAVLEKLDLATGRRAPLLEVGPRDAVGVSAIGTIVWSRDGQALAFSYYRRLSELYLVTHLR